MATKTICLLVLSTLATASLAQYASKAVLYSSRGCTGSSYTLPANTFVSNLKDYSFDNRAVSVQLTGAFLFYDNVIFNRAGNAPMEYVFQPKSACVNFNGVSSKVSSVRFAGDGEDYRRDSISFYKTTYFQGEEEFASRDNPNLSLKGSISSLIITGSSHWTIYDKVNYAGNAICLRKDASPVYEPAFVWDTLNLSPKVPHGAIASVRKGCFTQDVRIISSSGSVLNLLNESSGVRGSN